MVMRANVRTSCAFKIQIKQDNNVFKLNYLMTLSSSQTLLENHNKHYNKHLQHPIMSGTTAALTYLETSPLAASHPFLKESYERKLWHQFTTLSLEILSST